MGDSADTARERLAAKKPTVAQRTRARNSKPVTKQPSARARAYGAEHSIFIPNEFATKKSPPKSKALKPSVSARLGRNEPVDIKALVAQAHEREAISLGKLKVKDATQPIARQNTDLVATGDERKAYRQEQIDKMRANADRGITPGEIVRKALGYHFVPTIDGFKTGQDAVETLKFGMGYEAQAANWMGGKVGEIANRAAQGLAAIGYQTGQIAYDITANPSSLGTKTDEGVQTAGFDSKQMKIAAKAIGQFSENLVGGTAKGFLGFGPGMVMMATDPVEFAGAMKDQYKKAYGDLLTGNMDGFWHQFKEEPSQYLFDLFAAASVFGKIGSMAGIIKDPGRIAYHEVDGGKVQRYTSPNLVSRLVENRIAKLAEAHPDVPIVGAKARIKQNMRMWRERGLDREMGTLAELQVASKWFRGKGQVARARNTAFDVLGHYGQNARENIHTEIRFFEGQVEIAKQNLPAGRQRSLLIRRIRKQIRDLNEAVDLVNDPPPELVKAYDLAKEASDEATMTRVQAGVLSPEAALEAPHARTRFITPHDEIAASPVRELLIGQLEAIFGDSPELLDAAIKMHDAPVQAAARMQKRPASEIYDETWGGIVNDPTFMDRNPPPMGGELYQRAQETHSPEIQKYYLNAARRLVNKHKGALPENAQTVRKMQMLMLKLRDRAIEAEQARFWYETSAHSIMRHVKNDPAEATLLAKIIAIYSPRAEVWDRTNWNNTTRALGAYDEFKATGTISDKWSLSKNPEGEGQKFYGDTKANRKAGIAGKPIEDWQTENAIRTMKGEGDWDGLKTNSFYSNFLKWIDEPKWLEEFGYGHVTIDTWMRRAFEYLKGNKEQVEAQLRGEPLVRKLKKDGTPAPVTETITDPMYDFMRDAVLDISTELGDTIKMKLGSKDAQMMKAELGWEPEAAQAAIWTSIKSEVEGTPLSSAGIDFGYALDSVRAEHLARQRIAEHMESRPTDVNPYAHAIGEPSAAQKYDTFIKDQARETTGGASVTQVAKTEDQMKYLPADDPRKIMYEDLKDKMMIEDAPPDIDQLFQVQERAIPKTGVQLLTAEEAIQMPVGEGYVYHGTSKTNADQIMRDRKISGGVAVRGRGERAWLTSDPAYAAEYGTHVLRIPADAIPESAHVMPGQKWSPAGVRESVTYASKDDVLFELSELPRVNRSQVHTLDEAQRLPDDGSFVYHGTSQRSADSIVKGRLISSALSSHIGEGKTWVSENPRYAAQFARSKHGADGVVVQIPRSAIPESAVPHKSPVGGPLEGTNWAVPDDILFQGPDPSVGKWDPYLGGEVFSEAKPVTNPQAAAVWDRLPAEVKRRYSDLMQQSFRGRLEEIIGLPFQGDRVGDGVWRGQIEPGYAAHVELPEGVLSPAHARMMDELSAAQGWAQNAGSVSWTHKVPKDTPIGDDVFQGAHWVPKKGTDIGELDNLLNPPGQEGTIGFLHARKGGFNIVNFGHREDFMQALESVGIKPKGDNRIQASYTIDARAPEAGWPGEKTYQDVIAASPNAKALMAEIEHQQGVGSKYIDQAARGEEPHIPFSGADDLNAVLRQTGDLPNGFVIFDETGKAYQWLNPDQARLHTVRHEAIHAVRRQIHIAAEKGDPHAAKVLADLERIVNENIDLHRPPGETGYSTAGPIVDHAWKRDHEELLARLYEDNLRKGQTPEPSLREAYKMAQADMMGQRYSEAYKALRVSDRRILDALVDPNAGLFSEGAFYIKDSYGSPAMRALKTLPRGMRRAKKRVKRNMGVLFTSGRIKRGIRPVLEDAAESKRMKVQLTTVDDIVKEWGLPLDNELQSGLKEGYVILNPEGVKIPRTMLHEAMDDIEIHPRALGEMIKNDERAMLDNIFIDAETLGTLDPHVTRNVVQVPAWVKDEVMYGNLKLNGGGSDVLNIIGGLFDSYNNVNRLAGIYLKPAYTTVNLISNVTIAALKQGVFMPRNLMVASGILGDMSKRVLKMLDEEVGSGGAIAISGEGKGALGTVTDTVAHVQNFLADRMMRRTAIVHELIKADVIKPFKRGYDNEAAVLDFIRNPEHREMLNVVGMEAENSMVRFRGLSATERQVVSRAIYVYPWIKGATRFALRLPWDQPVTASVVSHIGQEGWDWVEKELGTIASFMRSKSPISPVRNGQVRVIDPNSLTAQSSGGEVLGAFLKTLQGSRSAPDFSRSLASLFTPSLSMLTGQATGANDYGRETGNLLEAFGADVPNVGLGSFVSQMIMGPKDSKYYQEGGRAEVLGRFFLGALYPRKLNLKEAREAGLKQLPTVERWKKLSAQGKEGYSKADVQQKILQKQAREIKKDDPDKADMFKLVTALIGVSDNPEYSASVDASLAGINYTIESANEGRVDAGLKPWPLLTQEDYDLYKAAVADAKGVAGG